jgi:CheY-like chemotaxis protein
MGLSILIADDNELNRWILAEQLQGLQANVSLTCDGAEAWNLLQAQTFDLAFFDVNMPVIGGRELVGQIRGHATLRSLYCVAITAHAQSGLRQLLLGEGFDDCLIKPILQADLHRIVSQRAQPADNINAETYAALLLDKVSDNRELAQLLLNKLFDQVPGQFERLQKHLLDSRFQDAWEVAHQLHGTFCFYGFEDFRALALVLEQSLMHATDGGDAAAQLQLLQNEFAWLTAKQAALLNWCK